MRLPQWSWLAAAALAALLVQRLACDTRLPRSCDTTYLWEGYEEVQIGEGERYRLIRFEDGDTRRLADYRKLQQLHAVPVLFVHGHMGTHQQMRSAASETGRELSRRLAADASWPLWLQWYATDFNAEPSALDTHLLEQQAKFVLRCIQHLQQTHTSSSGGSSSSGGADQRQPFRLVIVGYSMGGLVARDAVRQLAADPAFDFGQLVALVTLGSPHHFPHYMPHHNPLTALLTQAGSSAASRSSAAASVAARAAAAAAVPRINIAAGAGDHSLPQTLASAALPPPLGSGSGEASLMMDDMPGVWTTSNHKGIVSCNQLVRQLVPLLVDATLLSIKQQHASVAQRQAAVQQLLQDRLATNAGRALGLMASSGADAPAVPAAQPQRQRQRKQQPGSGTNVAGFAAAYQPDGQVEAALVQQRVAPGQMLRLRWDARQLQAAGSHGLLLLLTAAPQCTDWPLSATHANGSSSQLAAAAATLPPLLPDLQQQWVPRHWYDIMEGISWRENATRLLYVPFTDEAGEQLASVDVAVFGSASGSTAILAQVTDSHPSQVRLMLGPPGNVAHLPDGHAAALSLQLPLRLWPLGDDACSGVNGFSLRCLALLLVGSTPPWSLRLQALQCSSSDPSSSSKQASPQHLVPAVLGLRTGAAAADSVRVAPDAVPGGSAAAVPLWNGLVPFDHLMLISDPGCAYSLWLEWGVGGWLGLTLRHLLYSLPTMCMAASQARLSPMPGSTTRVVATAAAVAAWGSLHPAALQAATGLRPWVRLSVVEGLAALVLACGGASLLRGMLLAGLRLPRWALPVKPPRHAELASRLAMLAAVASSLLHPAVPAYLACICLAVRMAAASKQQQQQQQLPPDAARHGSSGSSSTGEEAVAGWHPQALVWLAWLSQLALLPTVGLCSWLASGRQQGVQWGDATIVAVVLALQACLLRCQGSHTLGSTGSSKEQRWHAQLKQLAQAAGHEAAACAAAASSLWGHPYITFYAAGVSAITAFLLGS